MGDPHLYKKPTFRCAQVRLLVNNNGGARAASVFRPGNQPKQKSIYFCFHLPSRRLNTCEEYTQNEPYGKVPVASEPDRERIRSDVENRIKSALDDIEAPTDQLFDSRGARAQRGRPLSSAFEEDDLNDEITESLKRLRASKKSSRFTEDIDFENSVSNFENRMRISDKILESVGIGQSEVSGARRALQENEERTEKRIARRLNEDNSLTKWTALKNFDDETAAAQRAKATRARLSDLEDEMTELSEKSAAREKRAARLRALVADTDSSDTTMASSKITIRSEREKKQVTF
ncbi:unnamed protein product [Parnassius apollo]|uniref:(apollo) hypothetical protein n=1 Tax=Parnassius apollo TaxID=110799 RepID=A0A8S3VY31_PARAO|nr:unnamed protein product [Parnassius apollo]